MHLLVDYVSDGQFEELIAEKTRHLLYYAAECALQLYIAESSEQI